VERGRASRTQSWGGLGSSTGNPRNLETTVLLSTITSGTPVYVGHLLQLQTAINKVRNLAGMGDFAFTSGVAACLPIRAIHILDLRSALAPAPTALQLQAVSYTTNVATGQPIRKEDVTDVQGGVR